MGPALATATPELNCFQAVVKAKEVFTSLAMRTKSSRRDQIDVGRERIM